ncbi:PREDICTED: protein C8orf37-like [Branchiostoma belcheri]|uniref:Cilia- and flagella-associated protein 418 n=1 Tax=Branchiostoma belcheri TaxID=7741 RepID=A0A6P5A6D8_BRABE|nr:PREDICTED: protein C8orf37-like [Branchiostoma belcheri]KAI8519756.1 hypothetical protein Bbelb_030130 [Branchiostoma belcheri]
MADDIDDLLDEVETKFLEKKEKSGGVSKTSKAPVSKTKTTVPTRKTSTGDADLDAMIDDICEAPEPLEPLMDKAPAQNSPRTPRGVEGKRRCAVLYLGGSKHAMGLGSSMNQRSCDQLRCTDCDFRVVFYDNYEWDATCEYLFFRNNVPDFAKLKAKLNKRKGSRAYACQCKWTSVQDLVDIQKKTDFKWVCGKHDS